MKFRLLGQDVAISEAAEMLQHISETIHWTGQNCGQSIL